MTAGPLTLPQTSPAAEDRLAHTGRWRGVVEMLLVGGGTIVVFPILLLLRKVLGLDSAELAIGFLTFYGAYVINDPHFTVTYLLFYRDARRRAFDTAAFGRAQRARYIFAGVVVPLALAAWAAFAIASRSAQTLGWMIQLMFLLVGWHYVKQGFGVMSVLSARRGFVLLPPERSTLLFHCYAGWAFAWANPASIAGEFEEKGVVYWAPAHPRWLELTTGSILAVSSVALLFVFGRAWRRGRRPPLAPLAGLLITVWSWTIFSSIDPLLRYVIPALHSVQYLYFVWLMRRNEARESEGPPTFGRPVAVRLGFLAAGALALGFLLFHAIPGYLDMISVPGTARERARWALETGLGETPFFAAFFVIVNVHHYFMDYVIWRRENPDTRFLKDPPPRPHASE